VADSPYIVDVTRENYAQLMQTSFEVPVLIDFWASWCQPCHALTPILAKLADEYQGRFLLGKLNTEEQQEIAAQFGIRSIPTVKLFRNGQPVDEFMGALPEQAVRQFLDQHLPRESDTHVRAAQQELLAGNIDAGIALLKEARKADPDNSNITIALAEVYAATGDTAAAEAALNSLPASDQNDPQVAALKSRLFFAAQVADAPSADELEAKLEANNNDHEARYQLALRRIVDSDYEGAMDLLLELMKADRSYGDDAGRNSLLKVFELLGDDPLVGQYRRKMASLLY